MIARQAASRHDTAHVRMPNQCLVPGVEDAQHTDLGTHVAWVGSDLPRRRGTDLKEPCVQTCAVPIGERQEPMQEREDDVDVWHAEELVLAGVEPARTRRTPSTRPVRTSVPAHSCRGLADCEGNWDERHRDAFNERFEAQGDRTRPRRGVHLYATD